METPQTGQEVVEPDSDVAITTPDINLQIWNELHKVPLNGYYGGTELNGLGYLECYVRNTVAIRCMLPNLKVINLNEYNHLPPEELVVKSMCVKLFEEVPFFDSFKNKFILWKRIQ